MTNYNPDCKYCRIAIYYPPIIGAIGAVVLGYLLEGIVFAIFAAVVGAILYKPFVNLGKRIPMLHEYFK